MKNARIFLLFSLCFLFLEQKSWALNDLFLDDTFLPLLSKSEVQSLRVAARNMLDNSRDGKAVYWDAPESGVRAKMEAQLTYRVGGATCRRMRAAFKKVKEKGKAELYKFDLCKGKDKWEFIASPFYGFTSEDWARLYEELQYTLENGVNQHPVSWVRRETGVSGVIVPLESEKIGGLNCRKCVVSVINKSGRTSDGTYWFCKQPKENTWTRQKEIIKNIK